MPTVCGPAGAGKAHDETGVGLVRDVFLPGGVPANGAEEAVGRRVPEAVRVSDGEPAHERPVEPHLDAMRASHADDVVVDHPAQPEPHLVVAVQREVVPDGHPAARAERQLLAGAVVLVEQPRRAVGGGRVAGPDGRIAHREAADAVRGRQVALEQGGGHGEHVAVRVESLRVDVVRREQQPALVDVDGQQLANGVDVLGRREAAHGGPARVRRGRRRPVELRFEPGHELPSAPARPAAVGPRGASCPAAACGPPLPRPPDPPQHSSRRVRRRRTGPRRARAAARCGRWRSSGRALRLVRGDGRRRRLRAAGAGQAGPRPGLRRASTRRTVSRDVHTRHHGPFWRGVGGLSTGRRGLRGKGADASSVRGGIRHVPRPACAHGIVLRSRPGFGARGDAEPCAADRHRALRRGPTPRPAPRTDAAPGRAYAGPRSDRGRAGRIR